MREYREGIDIRMLWHSHFYDGPFNGMADVNGVMVWFDCPDDDRFGWRRYDVFALTAEQIAIEVARHDEFDRMVGTHTNYQYVNGRRRREHNGLQPNWHDWYDMPHEPIDRSSYRDNPIGWFSLSPHNRRLRSRRYFERRGQPALTA